MKKLVSLFLCIVMLVCAAPIVSAPVAAEDYSQYNLTYYNVAQYTRPFWEGNVVVNECVYPIRAADGSLQPFKLMFPATQILYVRNYALTQTYTYGVDYALNSAGELVILPGGSIPVQSYRYIHPNTNPNNYDWDIYYPHRQESGIEYPGWEYWNEGSLFSNQQLCVTYVHEGNSYITRPEAVGDALPRTMAKLTSGQAIKIVTTGDSVTAGANASGTLNIQPSVPAYPQMTAQGLAAKFNNPNITLINSGIGGTTSEWTASTLNNTIISNNPDLVTICFGMNDSSAGRVGYTDSQFYNNMKGQINYIKSKLPNCEILLVSSIYGNYYTFPRERYESHAQILHQLAAEFAGQGVAVCDPQAIEAQMLSRKVFIDFMADNMVHPNDFGMRLITQTICDCLRYSSLDESADAAVAKIRAAVSPARGKSALYESMLSDFRAYFMTLSGDTQINAAIPAKQAELEAAMQYCADGYHAFVTSRVDPMCGTAGHTSDKCSYCGYETNVQTLPAIEGSHVYGETETILTATAYNEGRTARYCTKCGYALEATVPRTSSAVNHVLHSAYGFNYMQSNVYSYSSCGTVVFDIVPIDVTEKSNPSGPAYFGVWIGSSYTILAGYDFTAQKFVIGQNAMTFSSSMSNPLASASYSWKKMSNGNYPMHRFAVNVKGTTVKIYVDGAQVLSYTGSAISSSGDLMLAYAKGEYAIDNFMISNQASFNAATATGTTVFRSDFENGMNSVSGWTFSCSSGGALEAREFDMRGHYPEDHVHTNTKIASHAATYHHGSYDEYECTVCHERTVVDTGDPQLTGDALIHVNAVSPTCTVPGNIEYWYSDSEGKYYSDSDGENEIALSATVVPALGHSLTHVNEQGLEYWSCSRCSKTFSDAAGTTEITINLSDAAKAVRNKIAALGEVKYQALSSITASGMTGTFTTGANGANYSVLEVGNANSKLNADYAVEMKLRVSSVDTATQIDGRSGAYFGLFCETFCVGYDFASDQWGVCSGGGLWEVTAFRPTVRGQYGVLDDGVFHTVRIECKTTGISVYVDEICMLNTTEYKRQNYNYCIFYPRLCTVDFASYAFKYGDSWIDDHLTGSAIINASTWTTKGAAYGTSVRNYTGSEVVDSGKAIAEAEAAYNALSAAERATVTNHEILINARDTYDRLSKPTVYMSGTPDSSKITANVYFKLPARGDARNYTAVFGGASAILSTRTLGANGYKFSEAYTAKRMTDVFSYSVSDYYGNTVNSGTMSVAAYARILASGGYGDAVTAVANAMLVYGGAAQRYFGYRTDDLASAREPAIRVPDTQFDRELIIAQCDDASVPVTFSAMNVSFVSDTIMWIAFTVKDGHTPEEALAWVNSNVTLGGAAVSGTITPGEDGEHTFIVVGSSNIPIDRVTSGIALTVAGASCEISVLNYLSTAQSSDDADLVRLTKALYAYALAAEALS